MTRARDGHATARGSRRGHRGQSGEVQPRSQKTERAITRRGAQCGVRQRTSASARRVHPTPRLLHSPPRKARGTGQRRLRPGLAGAHEDQASSLSWVRPHSGAMAAAMSSTDPLSRAPPAHWRSRDGREVVVGSRNRRRSRDGSEHPTTARTDAVRKTPGWRTAPHGARRASTNDR